MDNAGDDDAVVRELDVYLCNESVGAAQLYVMAHPLRAPWRPYNYSDVLSMRMKPESKRVEVDLPISTSSRNYNKDAGGPDGYTQIEHLTLRSQQVDQPTLVCMGTLQDGKLLLAPIHMSMQMRPNLTHLNVTRKGVGGRAADGGGEEGEEEEEAGEPAMRAVEVQVQKRETERQQQARLNSYAYLAQKEAEEAWKHLNVYMDDTGVAERVWDHMMQAKTDQLPCKYLSRADYLRSFAPACASPAAAAADGSMDGEGLAAANVAPEVLPRPSLAQLSPACIAGFAQRMQALFAKHSVCSMENVRQWLVEPKHANVEAQKAAAAAAKDCALLEDKQLHELMMSRSGVPLACIRRMYVLKQTGKDTDAFRKVVVELLQEKEGFRKNEVTEAAHAKGLVVTDSMYIRVLKDMCVNRANLWQLKNGADL